jgi:hypothetical protein
MRNHYPQALAEGFFLYVTKGGTEVRFMEPPVNVPTRYVAIVATATGPMEEVETLNRRKHIDGFGLALGVTEPDGDGWRIVASDENTVTWRRAHH